MSMMHPSHLCVFLKLLTIYLLLLNFAAGQEQTREWDANTFPNPTRGQFRECNMRTSALICDPDAILSEADRNRVNHELQQLERRTEQRQAPDHCQKRGVTAALAIARKVKGGTTEAVKAMANRMLQTWSLDQQCEKSIVIVLITDDKKFWVARDPRVPVYGNEFTEIFNNQKQFLAQKDYKQALLNMVQGTWEKALSKQTGGQPARTGGQPQPQPDQPRGGGSGKPAFKMPGIPSWVWIALVCIVIPTIICCCCIYCCCCKKKGGDGGGGHIDQEDGRQGGGGGGGGGGGFGRFARGAGLGSLAGMGMNMLRGRGGGGGLGGLFGGRGGGGGRGAARPADTGYKYDAGGGGGLYPNAPVADQGGGGSWGDDSGGGATRQTGGGAQYASAPKGGGGGGGGW